MSGRYEIAYRDSNVCEPRRWPARSGKQTGSAEIVWPPCVFAAEHEDHARAEASEQTRFTGGLVYTVEPGADSQTVKLPTGKRWFDIEHNEVTEVTLAPGTGAVLTSEG